MTIQRVTTLTEPPVVGRLYLVPTALYPWGPGQLGDKPQAWPVLMPRHNDKEHLNFEYPHYHVDARFLPPSKFERAGMWSWADDGFSATQRHPLVWLDNGVPRPHPHPIWRRRRCYRAEYPYRHADAEIIISLHNHYAGRICRGSKSGWICPHKRFPMGSLVPDAEGVLTCPLHGLRVRQIDGVVLPSIAAPQSVASDVGAGSLNCESGGGG